jgi:hypothetical protein
VKVLERFRLRGGGVSTPAIKLLGEVDSSRWIVLLPGVFYNKLFIV